MTIKSLFTTLSRLAELLDGIQHYVAVLGKWNFDSNITFALPLTRNDLEYCCTSDVKNIFNGYNVVLKYIRFSNRKLTYILLLA